MPVLSAIPGAADQKWSTVLEANLVNAGSNPYAVWVDALETLGSGIAGPDDVGEYSSNCPNPGHNGGTGDQKASLRWRQAQDGQIVFHCHGSCDGEDITTTLGLAYVQLRWPRTEYHYRSEIRELLAIHVKAPQVGGKKRYWWEHQENGTQVNGRGTGWEPVLWCLPELQHAAEKARGTGRQIRVWLAEGEKDCVYVTYALENGWTPPGEESWVHLVTTGPDGAASWSPDLSAQVVGLGATSVTILCDSDEAGVRRGTSVTEALLETSPTLLVDSVSWVGHRNVKDAAEAINRFASGWLRETTATNQADSYLWCSSETGWLFEADTLDLQGSPTGRRGLHRTISPGTRAMRTEAIAKWPMRVVATTVTQDGDAVGWELDLGPGGTRPITAADLVGGALEGWNSRIGLFIVPTRGLGPALRAYLGYHSQNSPRMAVWDHEGWVDNQTFVTGAEVLIGPAGLVGRSEVGLTEWHYGLGDPAEAARIVADVLTFRPLVESAPVLAWLAAVSVRPKALDHSGASFVPMLQVPGDSGTGKTSFLRLATRLFGVSGSPVSNVTTAGLVRTLALSTQIVWIDDFANYDDTVRDIIRGGLTGAGRTRGTTASERGIVRDEARAALVNSGETAMGLEERAMRQRSVVVGFTERAQGRVSRREGSDRGQYADMVEYGVDRDDRGSGLSRWAGSVVRGLWEAAERLDRRDTPGLIGAQDGVREAAAWRFVEYGALVLGEWLRGEGINPARVAKLEAITQGVVRDAVAAAERRERSGADIHLVTTLVPAYIRSRRSMFDTAISGRLNEREELNGAAVIRIVREAWRHADPISGVNDGRPARGAVLILGVNEDPEIGEEVVAIALCAGALSEWAGSEDGRRAGIGSDKRFITREGIGMQVKAATAASRAEQFHAGGGAPGRTRVKLSGAQAPQYAVITQKDVIDAILGG